VSRARARAWTTIRETVAVVRAVLAISHEKRLVFMAASLAYFAVVSLVPLLLLVVIALSALRGEQLGVDIATYAAGVISPQSSDVLLEVVTSAPDRGSATLLGLGVLLWGTLLLFRALDDAFGQVYSEEQSSLFLGDLANALLVFFVVVTAIVTMIGVGAGLSVVLLSQVWDLLAPIVLVAVLTVVFLPMFTLFPDADVAVSQALPGTVFTAVGWTILQLVFTYYTRTTGAGELYGAAGAFLILLAWLYVGSLVVLVGAVLNAVLADHVSTDGELPSLGYI
jgi:membrane protein